MEEVRGQIFRDQTVVLDEKNFIDCEFHNCELQYHGGAVTFLETAILGCRWSFGGAAFRTLNLLQCFGLQIPPDNADADATPS